MPYLSASAVVIHYEEALYKVYAPLPLRTYIHTYIHTYTPLIALSSPLSRVVGRQGMARLSALTADSRKPRKCDLLDDGHVAFPPTHCLAVIGEA